MRAEGSEVDGGIFGGKLLLTPHGPRAGSAGVRPGQWHGASHLEAFCAWVNALLSSS